MTVASDGTARRREWAEWHGLSGWNAGCRCHECRAAAEPRSYAAAASEGPAWWVCRCGRKLYEHSMRTVPNTGGREYVCTLTASGRAEPQTGQDYGPESGLREKP